MHQKCFFFLWICLHFHSPSIYSQITLPITGKVMFTIYTTGVIVDHSCNFWQKIQEEKHQHWSESMNLIWDILASLCCFKCFHSVPWTLAAATTTCLWELIGVDWSLCSQNCLWHPQQGTLKNGSCIWIRDKMLL